MEDITRYGMEKRWNLTHTFLSLDILRAIIFAKDAITKPLPPIFTPIQIILQLLENLDIKTVEGTLLII